MVKYSGAALNGVFAALADPTRRAVLESLSRGSRPVTELAQPYPMSLPGFMKHLRVLEKAGLIGRLKEGRVVQCALSPRPMQDAVVWLERYRRFWEESFDRLDDYLHQLQKKEEKHGRKK